MDAAKNPKKKTARRNHVVLITLDWDHDYCASGECGASRRNVLLLAEVGHKYWVERDDELDGVSGQIMCKRLLWSNCKDLNAFIQKTDGVPRGPKIRYITMNVDMPFPMRRATLMDGMTVKNWHTSAKMARLLLESV